MDAGKELMREGVLGGEEWFGGGGGLEWLLEEDIGMALSPRSAGGDMHKWFDCVT